MDFKVLFKNLTQHKYSLYFVALFLNFRFNLFRIIPSNFFNKFEKGSEQLIVDRIIFSAENGLLSNAGLLLRFGEDGQISTYLGQLGFQGFIFGVINNLTFSLLPISFFHSLVSGFTALTLVGVFYNLDKLTNVKVSFLSFLVVLIASPFLSSMSRNLYWVPGTMFLPLLLMLLFVQDLINSDSLMSKKQLFLLSLVFMFRFSMGFEFTSSILIAGSIPLIFTIKKGSLQNYSPFLMRFLQYSFVSLSSFVIVLLFHIIQKAVHFGSFTLAIEQQLYNIAKRSNLIQGIAVESVYIDSLNANLLLVVLRYMMSPILIVISILSFVTILHFYSLITKRKQSDSSINILILSAWLSFLAPISWYVLASGHSVIHISINYILWSLPFSLFATSAIYEYTMSLDISLVRGFKISINIFIIVLLSVSVLFNSTIYSNNRETRIYALNIYHQIISLVSNPISISISVESIIQSNSEVLIIIPPTFRGESLLSLNGGKIYFGEQEFLCSWKLEDEFLLLSCNTENMININEEIIIISYNRELF